MSLYTEIIDGKNIEAAYIDLYEKFLRTGKVHSYAGIDGLSFADLDRTPHELLCRVQQELIDAAPLDPALHIQIPKKNGKKRSIYVYTVKDRIRAEAVVRVIGPYIEAKLSPFLFSYRSTHPYWQAARSVSRRHRKHHQVDTVFVSDVSHYFDHIDHDLLRDCLRGHGFTEQDLALIEPFLQAKLLTEGSVEPYPVGVMPGVPLATFFANLFLNHVDEHVGKSVALYRRCGDDFIVMDRDPMRVETARSYIVSELQRLRLPIQEQKTTLAKPGESFDFLGYRFEHGVTRLQPSMLQRTQQRYNYLLRYYPISIAEKLRRLPRLLWKGGQSIHFDFVQTLAAYRLVDDELQIKQLSESFYRALTRYFFGSYSPQKRKRMQRLTANMSIPSLYKYFLHVHHGRRTLQEVAAAR